MAHEYSKVFSNPYPSGWRNLPSIQTPILAQALQQHTNAIISIEDYLANNDIPTKISELVNDSINVPTKTSDLTNDSGFITANDIPPIPSKTSDLTNDSQFITEDDIADFITEDDVPTKLSELTNDMGFINTAVSNLLNYYLKSETYNRTEINNLIDNIAEFNIEVVETLPTQNISDHTIYLVPKELDNMVIISDYALNLDNNVVNNTESSFNVGEAVISMQEVGDPFA